MPSLIKRRLVSIAPTDLAAYLVAAGLYGSILLLGFGLV